MSLDLYKRMGTDKVTGVTYSTDTKASTELFANALKTHPEHFSDMSAADKDAVLRRASYLGIRL